MVLENIQHDPNLQANYFLPIDSTVGLRKTSNFGKIPYLYIVKINRGRG